MIAPASSSVTMLRAWIKFQGVSRGTTINLRRSFKKTSDLTAVERRNRRQDDRARFQERDDVASMDQIPRRLARHNDQLAALLQKNVGRTQESAVARTGGDPANRRHRTGHNHHRVKSRRAADERNIKIALAMLRDPLRN